MNKSDGDGGNAVLAKAIKSPPCSILIQRGEHRAIGADTLGNLNHALGQLLGQNDAARKDVGPRLSADAQCVA